MRTSLQWRVETRGEATLDLRHTDPSPIRSDRVEAVRKAVDAWKEQLFDATGRNQLLYYRTLKRGTLELSRAKPVHVDALLSGRVVRLSDAFPPSPDDPERFDDSLRRARTIYRRATAHFEERGIETLYVAVGMATWTTKSSSATPQAPVLLAPLVLKPRGGGHEDFDLRVNGDWVVNEALLQLLASEFAVRIDPLPLIDLLETSDEVRAFDYRTLFDRVEKGAADVPDFKVVARSIIGTFMYTKLPMVRDLEESIEALAAHDLIAAVAGAEDARAAVLEARAREVDPALPDRTPPEDEFLILDADASQNHAINAALQGEPLIIQGPPGTGKSQTIANLIASSTARGQKVLFVAEKRAAIDAVLKRLRRLGLEDVVLDLHGGVTSKKQLASELARSLRQIANTGEVHHPDLWERFVRARQALNEHNAALHEHRHPWDLSMWQVQEQALAAEDVPDPGVRWSGSQLEELDADSARQAEAYLDEWAFLAKPIVTGSSPWSKAVVSTAAEAQQALRAASELATGTAPSVRTVLDRTLEETGLPTPSSVDDWERTLSLLRQVEQLSHVFAPTIWDADTTQLSVDLAPASQGVWHRMTAQLFNEGYRTAKRAVREHWTGDKANGPTFHQAVETARDSQQEWVELGGHGHPVAPDNLAEADGSYQRLTERLAALGAFLAHSDLGTRSHRDLAASASMLVADQQTLFQMPRIHGLEDWFDDHGLTPLLDECRTGNIDLDLLRPTFRVCWLQSIRTHLLATDQRLASFNGDLLRRLAEDFRDADVEHLKLTVHRVRRAVAEHAVRARDRYPQEDQLVQAQANRKRGHLHLREMVERAPNVLTSLRPCWVMSPLVVSQTLPPLPLFDIVIFDEASQVLPADAVPALLRAPQAVVAGDRHQLPPTTFFDTSLEDDEDNNGAELTAGFESILDVLSSLLRDYMLTWHYRSHDERLIAFSNHNIYEGSLTTFPGARGGDCLDFELIPHRPGVRVDSRSNDDEVERVVELMLQHAVLRPKESLGVIAMGLHHANRIENLLRQRLSEEATLELRNFFDDSREERAFVKNLERVQGDERDAIIVTVGYAKRPDGRVQYGFGPLNMEGGERRLNVAVTRARRRLAAVSSFSHTEMDPTRTKRGADLLRRYLKYAASGGIDLDGAEAKTPLNAFELSVKDRLEREGLTIIPQYGASGFRIDFAVPHPDQPDRMILAIEADGASYHSSPTARDRDRLRQQVLEDLGWTFHRIWSTDWFNDQDTEAARVVEAYKQAVSAADDTKETDRRPDPPVPTPPDLTLIEEPPIRTLKRPPVPRGWPITDYRQADLIRLARWIESDGLLRTEDELLDELMKELGFKRHGKRIVAALKTAIRAVRRHTDR